ncbi:MAG: adenylate/guanylate cyclase domain-containing protein [Acidimicrobiia bacterium]
MRTLPSGTVTFLFTDLEASTRLWEAHPEVMKVAMARHDSIVESAITAHGGSVFTTAGDAFCAAFASPHGAILAAVTAQLGLADTDWGELAPFRVRMALHSGNADERGGDYFGPPLNRCARLLSTGHGGQVLLSSATVQLAQDDLPPGVSLTDLGTHELRDMSRAEHVFQLCHAGLPTDFPSLKSQDSLPGAAELLADGRQAHAANRWENAYRMLSEVGAVTVLTAEDTQRLAEAAFWTGRSDEGIALREKAYGAYVREGKNEAGALIALALGESYKYRLAKSVSNAWIARAERLLGDSSESEAFGYLLRWKCVSVSETSPDEALALADRVIAIGTRLGSRSLEALGLQDKGKMLVSLGQIDEGMRLVDEAMVAAVAGELDPETTGRSYCNMLAVCDEVADYQRASEWSDAAQAWCEQHSESAYPGVCRITRAELKWLHGDWDGATVELQQAIDELTGFTVIAGKALYQTGEIELRGGRLDAAEKSFRAAHEHGCSPLPGLAELRLRQGEPGEADQLLRDALRGTTGPLTRVRFLPALIDVQLALGRTDEARDALRELESVAETCASTALRAEAAHRRAALAIAEGAPADAIGELHTAIKGWTELQMPYETARTRLLLGEVLALTGNRTAARLELDTARSMFARLGAEGDVDAAESAVRNLAESPA